LITLFLPQRRNAACPVSFAERRAEQACLRGGTQEESKETRRSRSRTGRRSKSDARAGRLRGRLGRRAARPSELIQVAAHAQLLRTPPLLVGAVPFDRLADPVLERDLGPPAELALDLGVVEEVSAVVAGAILDVGRQRLRFPEHPEDHVRDLVNSALETAADVVGLPDAASLDDELDRTAMIDNVQPFAPVLAVTVERQRLVLDRV